jgi:uncharacterized protein
LNGMATHVLITGASAGLGFEFARLFAAQGFPLVLVARREDKLASLARVLRKDFEVDVRVIPADLTAPTAVEDLLTALQEAGVLVRVLINNAGVGSYGPFLDRDRDVYRRLIDLNVQALTGLARGLLPNMVACAEAENSLAANRCRPGIMNVASTAAFQPGPLMAVYFATKSYVLSFSEALHEEVKGQGVVVSAFCPGPTRTGFFHQGDMIPTGVLTENDVAEHHRRDARRMDPGVAAAVGYQGFLKGQAIVVPGFRNQLLAQAGRFLPRSLVRRLAFKMLKKN